MTVQSRSASAKFKRYIDHGVVRYGDMSDHLIGVKPWKYAEQIGEVYFEGPGCKVAYHNHRGGVAVRQTRDHTCARCHAVSCGWAKK